MWLGWGLVALATLEPAVSIVPVATTASAEAELVPTVETERTTPTLVAVRTEVGETKDLSKWFLIISLMVLVVIITAQVISVKDEDQS